MCELNQLIAIQSDHLRTAIELKDYGWEIEIENNLENLRIELDQVEEGYAKMSLAEPDEVIGLE